MKSLRRTASLVLVENKQSPLRIKPKRTAGQSVQEELDRLWDKCTDQIGLAVLAVVFLLQELWRWLWKIPPNPLAAAIVCLPLLGYAVYRLVALRSQIKEHQQALNGEKIVGEKLENLRAHGYRVFHDLIGNEFNVDHVLVGPAGVFTIETKTWSKGKGDKIQTDGRSLWKNGIEIKPSPIDQAKAQARWLHGLIKELTNESAFVQPVIVFPGWWVESKTAEPQTLVLNPDQLEGWLKKLPTRLEQGNIGLIANRLELLARRK
ncbi:MAG: NERD domain-containing protein [Verrucomicrobiota bacterium]|nr:NERD domain-containing protein [Verrucomicrobiota bacterium]